MKKLHNISQRGSGTRDEFYEHIVKRMNENLAEIAAEVGGLTLEEGSPYFPVKILTYEVEGGNGDMIAILKGQEVTSGDEVIVGKNIQFFAAPDEGYLVKKWIKDSADVEDHIDDSLVLTMPDADMEVKVEFIQAHLIAYGVGNGEGEITAEVDGDAVPSDTLIRHEKEVVFTAVPSEGYRIEDWLLNSVSQSEDGETFTISSLEADAEVIVDFLKIHEVTFEVEGENGTMTAAVDGTPITTGDEVDEGKTVNFTAAAAGGFKVKEWKVNGVVVDGNTTESYDHVNIEDAINVTVEFETE